jgi:hypothetical protein
VPVGAVNQKRELIAESPRIASVESVSKKTQASAHFHLVGARNCRTRVLSIWKFSGEIDEGAAAKLRICDLFGDALKQRFDLLARRARMACCSLISPLPEPPILLLGKRRNQRLLGSKSSIKRRLR